MPFDLADEIWDAFMRGIARGAYSLLLGAGASRDGRDSLGDQLPLGGELANDLVDEFELPADHDSLTLVRAYEAAERRGAGRNYPSVDDYLHERFTGCTPPAWFNCLTRVRWRRIYSLNIDDAVDAAYVDARDHRVQRLVTTHWSHPFFEPSGADSVTLVHLHGRARLLGETHENNLVFGLAQYFDATSKQHTWHRVFGDTFQREPYLVIGATLSQEFDLADVLRRGNSSFELQGMPSLVVLPAFEPMLREELIAFGMHPVESGGAEFLAQVVAELPGFLARVPAPPGGSASPITLKFLSQFRELSPETEPERDRAHDLYSGQDPTWQDIVRDRDAVFRCARSAATLVTRGFSNESPARVLCIHGDPFTGKSTALLRAGRELLAQGLNVCRFVGEERVDVPAVLNWSRLAGPTVLLFDGMGDYAADYLELLDALDGDRPEVIVLGAERRTRLRALSDRLPAERLGVDQSLEMGLLGDDEINALIAKLRDAGRLGRIAQRSRGGQLVYFRTENERHLFPAMEGLEHAGSFRVRLRQTWDAVQTPEARDAYALCAMVHSLGYPTPVDLLARACGTQVRVLLRAVRDDEAFDALLTIADGNARTRQRTLASLFLDRVLDPERRFDMSARLAQALAPYVSRESISQRSLYSRIAGQLMDERIVSEWVGRQRAEDWYEQQADAHGWNARFWEQRSLAATNIEAWDRAESYAEQAAAIHADAFTLNTLATVLLRKALAVTDPGSDLRWDYHRRARVALTDSRNQGNERFMHPYVTFFDYTLRLAEEDVARGGAVQPPIQAQWNDWVFRARNSGLFVSAELHDQLEGYVTRWLMLAAR